MKHGKSELACNKDHMKFLEDRATNHPHDINWLMIYNTNVKKAKHTYREYKDRYKSVVDEFAQHLKDHVEATSGEEDGVDLLQRLMDSQKEEKE